MVNLLALTALQMNIIIFNSTPPHLLPVLQGAASLGFFPMEMLKAHIVTLPKPGKSPTKPSNFHSIFLLNVDIKIYAKLLAKRLIDIIPALIKPDQLGFTKGC